MQKRYKLQGPVMKFVTNHYKTDLGLFRLKEFLCIFLLAISILKATTLTDPFRLEVRHIESKGIGYNQGYSTFEAFYASTEAWKGSGTPFLDVQGHLFNNGRAAVNAGIGVRYGVSRVWGMNGFYDYRNTFRGHYNQVSFGLESLGRVWDFRLNIYHPFGKKIHYFDAKKEFALQTVSGEAGIHVNTFEKSPLYFAAGPYYLNGEGKTAWGGKMRGSVDMYEHIRLEISSSYDHLYKWIGQGQLSIFFLFGGKKEGKPRSEESLQRAQRNEIIPVNCRQ